MAIECRASSPYDSVSTGTSTSPFSLPTLVHQEALPAAAPCNFLHTFFVKSIFNTLPKIAVEVARSWGSLLGTHGHQPPTCVKASKHVQCCNWSPQHSYWALGIPANGTGSTGTERVVSCSAVTPWLWWYYHSQYKLDTCKLDTCSVHS